MSVDSCPGDEFLRYMHIGLLCVQEDAYDRPTMSSVGLMLKNESAMLGQPERPPFSLGRFNANEPDCQDCSLNFLTLSDIVPQWMQLKPPSGAPILCSFFLGFTCKISVHIFIYI